MTPIRAHDAHVDLLAARSRGVLATQTKDGRPQLSNIDYTYDGGDHVVRMSSTGNRAKVRNVRRDPRVSLHVTTDDGGAWTVAEGVASLTPAAADPHDATVEALIAVYRAIQGDHPDWDDYRAAMVADRRLVITLHVERTYGWTPPTH